MTIIKYRRIFFSISLFLVLISVFSIFFLKPVLGTDFSGGSILEVSYLSDRPSLDEVKEKLNSLSLGNYSLRPSSDSNFILRTREINDEEKTTVVNALSLDGALELSEERFNSIGPVVGASLKSKSYKAISVVVIAIVLFVTFAFRKVSRPVASWKYGVATIIALAHDILVPTGIYIIFGRYFGAEIDLLFVTALLAILGYSVHDTIVVFDRVRERLRINSQLEKNESFDKTVGESLRQTMGRSINTSLTVFLVLIALFFIGSESTRNFTFILITGIVAGTYSSIFLASPLLVTLEKLQKKKF